MCVDSYMFLIILKYLVQGVRIVLYAMNVISILEKLYLKQVFQTRQIITYSGPRKINSVSDNIRRCESFLNFKNRLKAHISSNNGG